MRLGIVAFEHPPALGGMERLAAMHIRHLSQRHEVVVHTREPVGEAGVPGARYVHGLTGSAKEDVPRLEAEAVDGWLICNAGFGSYIPRLSAPAVCMSHGNDFLRPWAPGLPSRADYVGRIIGKLAGEASRRVFEIKVRQRLLRRGMRSAARVVACSNFSRRVCLQLIGGASGRVAVVHPGLEDQWFELGARRRRSSSNVINLLSVARLTSYNPRKNIEGVIRALAMIGDQVELTYTVVGEGDDRARLMALAESLGLADRVHFLGGVSAERLQQAYLDADVFVLVVQSVADDVEGFGMVYTEAAATGIPSLGARSGGVPDAVSDGVSGILIDQTDPPAIAEGIRQFAERRADFDLEQIRAFADSFRIQKIGPQLERIVVDAINGAVRLA